LDYSSGGHSRAAPHGNREMSGPTAIPIHHGRAYETESKDVVGVGERAVECDAHGTTSARSISVAGLTANGRDDAGVTGHTKRLARSGSVAWTRWCSVAPL